MLIDAKYEAHLYESKVHNSIRKGQGTFFGCLGESLFHHIYPNAIRANTYDYDFIYYNKKIDIKTKERTVPPKIHYECSVNTMNGKQNCDYYVFTQILDSATTGWILGKIPTEEFFDTAKLYKKGTRDPRNNFTFHCDTYNIPISQLYPVVV